MGMFMDKLIVAIGSALSIGFGVWHFFVPGIWNWYSYIDPRATELVLAVRAINFFFSLSLILFGAMNLFLAFIPNASKGATILVLSATVVLWLSRVIMQVLYPQGSMQPLLRYGMLCIFVVILCCYAIPLLRLAAIKDR